MASKALPKWSGWLGYAGTVLCLAFVPSMFRSALPDLTAFYNPAGVPGIQARDSRFPEPSR